MRPNHLRDSDNASSTTLLFARRISVFSPIRESQRDSVSMPRVARHELPWVIGQETSPTATRLRPERSARAPGLGHNAVGVVAPSERQPKVGVGAPTFA